MDFPVLQILPFYGPLLKTEISSPYTLHPRLHFTQFVLAKVIHKHCLFVLYRSNNMFFKLCLRKKHKMMNQVLLQH